MININKKVCFRYAIWLSISVLILYSYFRNNDFAEIFTAGYIVESHHVSPWGVLFLCFLWLILKRGEIKGNLHEKVSPVFLVFGLGIVCLSNFIPTEPDFIILKSLAACLGIFTALFGRASLLPVKLLAVYAFTILMPVGVEAYLERPYALAAVAPAVLVSRVFGLPVTANEQILTLQTISGESISVVVTAACAGPATMAVFISIFTLMMMDVRLPGRAAAGVFAFGAVGTWVQSVLRIVIIMSFGHYGGAPALWKAHFWTIYILFPLWYLIFTAVYFSVSGKASRRPALYSQRHA